MNALASKKSGMTQDEILKITGLYSGGRFTRLLNELEASGFVLATTEFFYKKKENKKKGAQIDLVIDRADNCINLFEIKFCNGNFLITKSYADNLNYKKLCFQEQTKTKKKPIYDINYNLWRKHQSPLFSFCR